jgi:hypothetical protein
MRSDGRQNGDMRLRQKRVTFWVRWHRITLSCGETVAIDGTSVTIQHMGGVATHDLFLILARQGAKQLG